jgi:hypothetical protein
MHEVDLPSLKTTTMLKSALETMRERKCSGLISEHDGVPVVITLRKLLAAVREHGSWTVSLDKVRPEGVASQMQQPPAHRPNESASLDWFNGRFPRGASHAVIGLSQSVSRLVTPNRRVAESVRLTVVVCTCKQDDTHVWMHDELTDGKCGFEGSDVNCR